MALIGLVLVFFQVILYVNYAKSVSDEFDIRLKIKAEQIGGAVNTFRGMLGKNKQGFLIASQEALNLSIQYPNYLFMLESPEKFWLADAKKLGLDHDYLLIIDAQGNIISHSSNVTTNFLRFFHNLGGLNHSWNMFYKANIDNHVLRIVTMPYYYAYNQGYTIVVGTSYDTVERILRRHVFFVILYTLLYLVIASFIVRLFVIRVLASVLEISKVARNISHENLSARIKLTHTDEEIQHLTVSLNEMIARLEKSFAHIKDFSLEMAHEVKTPLAIINGESQMALDKDLSREEYKEIFKIVIKEAKRTQKFVSDLLLLTKLDNRLITMRFQPIDLSVFLEDLCKEMLVLASSKGVSLECSSENHGMFIKGDKTHLERVFFNLIDNALKFTPKTGQIEVSVTPDQQKIIILVSDTGSGIAQNDLPNIFNKFYHADRNESSNVSGCGLGLSIVYSIIELHGGSITVSSQLKKGSIFRIELPRLERLP